MFYIRVRLTDGWIIGGVDSHDIALNESQKQGLTENLAQNLGGAAGNYDVLAIEDGQAGEIMAIVSAGNVAYLNGGIVSQVARLTAVADKAQVTANDTDTATITVSLSDPAFDGTAQVRINAPEGDDIEAIETVTNGAASIVFTTEQTGVHLITVTVHGHGTATLQITGV